MSLHPTRVDELPEIGAVHVLAVDIFIAVQDAYYPRTGHRIGLWQELSTAQKCAYIAAAKTLLESYRPQETRSPDGDGRAIQTDGDWGTATPLCDPIDAVLDTPRIAGSIPAESHQSSVLAFPQPQDGPPRCIYCGDPAPTGDYCSLICEIDAQND